MRIFILLSFIIICNSAIAQNFDSECVESIALVSPESNLNYTYNAKEALRTTSSYSVTSANGEIRLKAGKVIVLEPNTYIKKNSLFLARIESCAICELTFDYPKYFTPNGDTYNDKWQVNWNNAIDFSAISIFDRYGKLIKILNNPNEFWDGAYNKTTAISTDYWFTLMYTDCNGIRKEFKSHFSLKR